MLFGSGDAGDLADETFYRAGGRLRLADPHPGLLTTVRPITAATERERRDGYATHSLENQRLDPGDLVVVHSASGRNAAPVEVALWARERGARTIGITSVAFRRPVRRNGSVAGSTRWSICVIDTGMPSGDVAVRLPGISRPGRPDLAPSSGWLPSTPCSVRRVASSCRTRCRAARFTSSNIDGGDERNRALPSDMPGG